MKESTHNRKMLSQDLLLSLQHPCFFSNILIEFFISPTFEAHDTGRHYIQKKLRLLI